MKHIDVDSCACGVCTARAFQRRRKGHPYFKGNRVWVRAFRGWQPGTVVKVGPRNVHVRYVLNNNVRVKAVDACAANPEIHLFDTPEEQLP